MERKKNGTITFPDYPEFRPNLTPSEIFRLGSFGGTYWRPIYSHVTKNNYKNAHKRYPKSWFKGMSPDKYTSEQYDPTINKYGVKVGESLRYWETKKWITKYDPYGWVQWYCNFYMGRRCPDDERQIKRWEGVAGPNGRFRRRLINMIHEKRTKWNDAAVSPKIRQTLQHWAYVLTAAHANNPH